MKTIVALIDFSNVTERVIQQATALANAFQSHVILLHAVPPQPEAVDVGLVSPILMRKPTAEQWTAHQERLIALRDSLISAGIHASSEQAAEITRENILAEAKRLGADLIIMGSRHHGFFYDLFVGSVAHDVLKHAACPVLVIPAEEAASVQASAAA